MGNIGTHAVNQSLFKAMPYDTLKDFVPVAHVLDAEGLLVVHPSVAAKTVPELIALGAHLDERFAQLIQILAQRRSGTRRLLGGRTFTLKLVEAALTL